MALIEALSLNRFHGFTYDLQDQPLSYQAFGAETVTNQYNIRGELLPASTDVCRAIGA